METEVYQFLRIMKARLENCRNSHMEQDPRVLVDNICEDLGHLMKLLEKEDDNHV